MFRSRPKGAYVIRKQIEQRKLHWNSFIEKMTSNGWAQAVGSDQLLLIVNLDLERARMAEVFGSEFPKVFPVLQQAYWRFTANEWGESIFIALILAVFIRQFFFQAFRIPSGSMRMTLLERDRIIVNKLHYGAKIPLTKNRLPGFSHPKRGDVIVFVYPDDPKKDFIKRLVAMGGETVEIDSGRLLINGREVNDPEIRNTFYYNRGKFGAENQRVEVPKGFYYVLGDNSASSHDSRFWGFVPEENVIGKAEFIYWPLQRIRFIKGSSRAEYE